MLGKVIVGIENHDEEAAIFQGLSLKLRNQT
jgi:hypothetical protein